MIDRAIRDLVLYGERAGLLEKEDEIYARNRILEVLGRSEYTEPEEAPEEICREAGLKSFWTTRRKTGFWSMTAWFTGICLIRSLWTV